MKSIIEIETLLAQAKPAEVESGTHKDNLRRSLQNYKVPQKNSWAANFMHSFKLKAAVLATFILVTVVVAFFAYSQRGSQTNTHQIFPGEIVAQALKVEAGAFNKYYHSKFLVDTYANGNNQEFLYELASTTDNTNNFRINIERDVTTGKILFRNDFDQEKLSANVDVKKCDPTNNNSFMEFDFSNTCGNYFLNVLKEFCGSQLHTFQESLACKVKYYNSKGLIYVQFNQAASIKRITDVTDYIVVNNAKAFAKKWDFNHLYDASIDPQMKLIPSMSEADVIQLITADGYKSLTIEQMNSQIAAIRNEGNSDSPDQQYKDMLAEEKKSDPKLMEVADVGPRRIMKWEGHYFIQIAPIISYKVDKTLEDTKVSQADMLKLILASGYSEISMEEYIRILAYPEAQATNDIFFSINPATSALHFNLKGVYTDLKNTADVGYAGMATVNNKETYILTWNSELNGKKVANYAYFGQDSYELEKFEQFLDVNGKPTNLISYQVLSWEYTMSKPVIAE